MNPKPHAPKYILSVVIVTLLVIGSWATTVRISSTTKAAAPPPSRMVGLQPKPVVLMSTGTDLVTDQLELDGDITDSPLGLPDDWDTINCGGGNALTKTGVLHDGLGTSIFTGGGSKDPDLLSSWKHKDGSVPDKDEIINAYAAKYVGPTGDDIIAFGADRYDNSGTAFIGFWFFKSPVYAAADGRFRQGPLATDSLAVHEIGDVLVLIEFTNGGTVATAKVFEWVGSGGSESGGTLNDITATAPVGSVLSISNISPQTIPGGCAAWQYTPKGGSPGGAIPTNAFFEGAINISAFPALAGSCFSSFLTETRSAASVTSTLKDFVLGQFNTCVSLEVTKTASVTEACAGTPVDYTYTVHNTAGVAITVNLVDDNGTPGNQADDVDVDGGVGISLAPNDQASGGPDETTITISGVLLPVGTTTNTVTATGSFGGSSQTATATATVVINPNPTCSVSPLVTERCAGQSATFTVTPSSGTAPYTISWSGPGGYTAGNVSSITVNVGGIYTANITDSKGCTTSCSGTLVINPTPSCSVSPSTASRCVDGPAQTFTVTPTGGTSTYSYSWSGPGGFTAGNVSSISVTAAGTYTAFVTDSKGCTTMCSATLAVTQKPTVSINSVVCSTAASISLTATPSGGSGSGFTYSWSGPGSFTSTSQTITASATGTYTVIVTDSSGCTGTASRTAGLCAP